MKGEKPQQEPKGLCQGYIHGGPQCGAFETNNHCLGSKSIIGPNPMGRVNMGGGQQLMANPPPGFVEIMRSLWGDNPPHEVVGIPPKLAGEQGPIQVVGSAMFSARLVQDMISGSTYIDVMTCSMSLVGLGVTPLAGDCSMPTLLGEEDTYSD